MPSGPAGRDITRPTRPTGNGKRTARWNNIRQSGCKTGLEPEIWEPDIVLCGSVTTVVVR